MTVLEFLRSHAYRYQRWQNSPSRWLLLSAHRGFLSGCGFRPLLDCFLAALCSDLMGWT